MASATKVVLITGGNAGLGYHLVKVFLQADASYHILMHSRSAEKANAAVESLRKEVPNGKNKITVVPVDLEIDESIEKAFAQVKADPGRLDIIINNAGQSLDMLYTQGMLGLRESFMGAYAVNVAGTQVLTYTFMPLLLQSSDPRLLFISGLSHITQMAEKYYPTPDLPAGWPKQVQFETIGYKCSKCALNMLVLDWNHKLKADGVKVWGVGPGMMLTNLGYVMPQEMKEEMNLPSPDAAAAMIMGVVEGERDVDTGKLVTFDNGFAPW